MSVNYIAEIKKHSIVDYFSYEGIPLTSNGKTYSACCPLHNEKTPSFHISPEKGRWTCYGSCKKSGDIIDFVCDYKNLEKVDAIEYLCKVFSIPYKIHKKTEKKSKAKVILEINQIAAEFYHSILTKSPLGKAGRKYFFSRLNNSVLIEEFNIGYAPDSSESGEWTTLSNHLSKQGADLNLALSIGLLRRSPKTDSLYDAFRGRLVFPIYSLSGSVVGWNTRILPEYHKSGSPKYLLSNETEVFKKSQVVYGYNKTLKAIKANNEVLHVEGVWDFLNLYSKGFTNVVPHFGAPTFIPPVDNHIILMDPDSAGIKYSMEFGAKLLKELRVPRIKTLPRGKDPSDLNTEEIEEAISSAESFTSAFLRLNYRYPDSIEHKMVVLDKLIKELNGIDKEIMMLYAQEIEKKMGLPMEMVLFRAGLEDNLNYGAIFRKLKLEH